MRANNLATSKVKSRPVFKQLKPRVYQTLYSLNMAFECIALEIEHLDDFEVVPLPTLRIYRATAEELRATMNYRVLDVLLSRELKDRSHYSKRVRALQPKK